MMMTPQEQVNSLIARMDQIEAELEVANSVLLVLCGVFLVAIVVSLYKVTRGG